MTETELKVPPKLSAMPRHVKERIVESLGTADKLNLREVDFQFKEIVGNARIHYEELKITLTAKRVKLRWDITLERAVELEFLPRKRGYEVIRPLRFPVKSGKGDYRKAAVSKMLSIFKNPKVTVGRLVMGVDNRDNFTYQDQEVIFEEIERILSRKNFRVNLGMLETRFPISKETFMSVLPYLEPGTFKFLHLFVYSYPSFGHASPGFDDRLITDTEQWRQLKKVRIEAFDLNIPLDKYLHFERIELRFSRPTETAKTILEKVLEKPTMKQCDLVYTSLDGFDMTGTGKYVDQFEKVRGLAFGNSICIRHPYEAGKIVIMSLRDSSLRVEKRSE